MPLINVLVVLVMVGVILLLANIYIKKRDEHE